jgi:hypothetical protein
LWLVGQGVQKNIPKGSVIFADQQIDNYLDELARLGARYAVYRYDAGHGSMVVAERLRQLSCEIAFVRDALETAGAG